MKNKKHLPIRIFEKRHKIDESLTEGMKGPPPKWTLNGKELEVHAKELGVTLDHLENTFDNKTNKGIPSTLQIHLIEKAYAKTHRAELRKLFDVNQKTTC